MTIGPKANPRPLILHVDSDTSIPYRLAESDSLYIGSLSANDYSNLNISGIGGFPSQTGNNGKYLTTDGAALSWATVAGGGSSWTMITKSSLDSLPEGTAVMANEGELSIVLSAGKSYQINYTLFFSSAATATHQIQVGLEKITSYVTMSSIYWNATVILPGENENPLTVSYSTATDSTYINILNPGNGLIKLNAIIGMGSGLGSFADPLQFRYGVNATTAIGILPKSYVEYREY